MPVPKLTALPGMTTERKYLITYRFADEITTMAPRGPR